MVGVGEERRQDLLAVRDRDEQRFADDVLQVRLRVRLQGIRWHVAQLDEVGGDRVCAGRVCLATTALGRTCGRGSRAGLLHSLSVRPPGRLLNVGDVQVHAPRPPQHAREQGQDAGAGLDE